jgi:hypothetical protein
VYAGGKDSTVLAHILTTLNERYSYGLDLFLLSIDEGITGYRDDSLETVKRNEKQYGIPLKILSYKELYGWTMDEIVRAIGHKNNCTFCGVFRRQALDRGANLMKADKMATGRLQLCNQYDLLCRIMPLTSILPHVGVPCVSYFMMIHHTPCAMVRQRVPLSSELISMASKLLPSSDARTMTKQLCWYHCDAGHNADDIAETVLLNILRGDVPRLSRCANIITGEDSALPRVKPFKYTYEKEIVMYAFFKKLDYFSTECVYAPFAARGAAREFVKDLEVDSSPLPMHAHPGKVCLRLMLGCFVLLVPDLGVLSCVCRLGL